MAGPAARGGPGPPASVTSRNDEDRSVSRGARVPGGLRLKAPQGVVTEILGNGAVVPGLTKRAVCGWHGTILNEETGAFCIVKQGGALADYLGERVRVRARYDGVERSVVAYCHTQADIPNDLSLTRALFMRLGPAALDNLVVTVEVLA